MYINERVTVLSHPLVLHRLRWLRDEKTTNPDFLRLAGELSRFIAYEAFRDAPLTDAVVDTPVADTSRRRCRGATAHPGDTRTHFQAGNRAAPQLARHRAPGDRP